RAPGVERAHQHLRALVDHALGLDAAVLGLALRVARDQLELQPALALHAAGGVDGLDGELGAEPAGLARLGERARHGVNRADLERSEERRVGKEGRGGWATEGEEIK